MENHIVSFQPNSDQSRYFLSDGLRIIKSHKEKCMSTKKKPATESIVRDNEVCGMALRMVRLIFNT